MAKAKLWTAAQGALGFGCMTDEHVANAVKWVARNPDWVLKNHSNIDKVARLQHEHLRRLEARRAAPDDLEDLAF